MEKKNKLILPFLMFFLILFLLLFLINYNIKNQNNLQSYLNKFKVSWKGTENFIVNVSLTQQTENKNKLMAINKNKIIRLEILTNIDEKTSEDYIRNKKYITDSLFLNIATPYPDFITNTLECPERFKPEVKKIKIDAFETTYYEIFATNRLIYGACAEDLIKYKAILTWIYCEKGKSLFQVELFMPKDEFKEDYTGFIKSFECKK